MTFDTFTGRRRRKSCRQNIVFFLSMGGGDKIKTQRRIVSVSATCLWLTINMLHTLRLLPAKNVARIPLYLLIYLATKCRKQK